MHECSIERQVMKNACINHVDSYRDLLNELNATIINDRETIKKQRAMIEELRAKVTKSGKWVKGKYFRESHWIPCTPETMPEEAETYLCTCADAGRLMVTLIKWQPRMKSWNLTGARSYWKVIAWMPLPEPWKGEQHG